MFTPLDPTSSSLAFLCHPEQALLPPSPSWLLNAEPSAPVVSSTMSSLDVQFCLLCLDGGALAWRNELYNTKAGRAGT